MSLRLAALSLKSEHTDINEVLCGVTEGLFSQTTFPV